MKRRKSISKATRQKVLDKYGGHCAYCGKILDLKTLRVDHLHPHYLGGEDDFDNYMPACYQCNFYKSTLLLDEFREQMSTLYLTCNILTFRKNSLGEMSSYRKYS